MVDTVNLINRLTRDGDQLSDALAGDAAFPLALLLDQVVFALKVVIGGDDNAEAVLEDLKKDADRLITRTVERVENVRDAE